MKPFLKIRKRIKKRRERIATAALQGMLANGAILVTSDTAVAQRAVMFADALIAELDKE